MSQPAVNVKIGADTSDANAAIASFMQMLSAMQEQQKKSTEEAKQQAASQGMSFKDLGVTLFTWGQNLKMAGEAAAAAFNP